MSLPGNLFLTIVDEGTVECECLAGSYPISRPGSDFIWIGSGTACSGKAVIINFRCTGGAWAVQVTCDGELVVLASADDVNCEAPSWTFDNGGDGYEVATTCCTGTISITVTA